MNLKKKRAQGDQNYPTYSRGVDPNPLMPTYMYNDHLNATGDEENEIDNKLERLRVVSPQ